MPSRVHVHIFEGPPDDEQERAFDLDALNEPTTYAQWESDHIQAGYRIKEAQPVTRWHTRTVYAFHPSGDHVDCYYAMRRV